MTNALCSVVIGCEKNFWSNHQTHLIGLGLIHAQELHVRLFQGLLSHCPPRAGNYAIKSAEAELYFFQRKFVTIYSYIYFMVVLFNLNLVFLKRNAFT